LNKNRGDEEMQTKVLKRSVPLWALIVAMTCVGVVVFSVVQFTYQITNTMTVRADYSIEVWNEGKTSLVTSIDWGEFANLNEAKDTILWIKNVGNKYVKYSWNATSLSSQFSITNQWWDSNNVKWQDLNQDTVCTFLMFPNDEVKIKFTLNCTMFSAGSYSFTLNIMSNES
jgi:hypothetical protein